MPLSRIKRHFAAFGADTTRWPRTPYARLLAALARRSHARQEQLAAAALDRALDAWTLEAPPAGLVPAILRQALTLPQQCAAQPEPENSLVVWPFASFWPGLATFALALLLGCLLGWYGGSGAQNTLAEDWLSLAAMAPVHDEAGD